MNNFTLDDDGGIDGTYSNVFYDDYIAGQYTVTEGANPDWELTSLVCDDAGSSTDLGTRTASIDLDIGEVITCTFVNEPVVSVCGNGVVEVGEQCDDGNLTDGDGCSSICEDQILACFPTDEDVLTYLPLDELAGFTSQDMTGSNDGTWVLDPLPEEGNTSLPFYNGSGLSFDESSYLDLGDVLDMGTSDMSVSLWFKTTDDSYSLFSKSFYGGAASRFFLVDEGTGLYAGFHGTSIVETTPRITGMNDGEWHLATVVFDRDGSMSLYFDGSIAASADISAQSAHDMQSTYNFFLARYNDAVDGTNPHPSVLALDGVLDDVRVFDRALTESEVTDLYAGSCDVAPDPEVVMCESEDEHLIAHWQMEENAGATTDDSTPYNNQGSLSGPVWSSDVPTLAYDDFYSLSFDGSDDVVTVSDTSGLDFGSEDPFSASAWVNPDGFSGYQTVLHTIDDSTAARRGYLLTLNNGVPELWLISDYDGGSYLVVPAISPLSTGVWQQVGFSYDGSGEAAGVRIYVNGADVTNAALVDSLTGDFSPSAPFELGRRSVAGIQPFDGLMDDVRVYDAALDATQMGDLYAGSCDVSAYPVENDDDSDGVENDFDNCPDIANPDQEDNDDDGEGDLCDDDDDNDEVVDAIDNCPLDANEDQADADEDDVGNVCDDDFVPEPVASVSVPDDDNDGGTGSGHRGKRTNIITGVANFLTGNLPGGAFGGIAPGAFGGANDEPLSEDEIGVICSMQRALPSTTTSAVYKWLARHLAPIMNRDAEMLYDALRDPTLCVPEETDAGTPVAADRPFRVDLQGFPVSTNDTWNGCIRNEVTLSLIRNNTDKDEDGLGRDCSYYRTGSLWRHPDLNIYFTFDREKRNKITLPEGFAIKQLQSVGKL